MDIYLPADFHALHDEFVTDWRDAHSSSSGGDASAAPPVPHGDERNVDPSWLAI